MVLKLPHAALIAALMITACSFDTSILDERRCSDDNDCDRIAGFFCIEGVCQGLGNRRDVIDTADGSDTPDLQEPCVDIDGDLAFAGPNCEAAVIDCNDFDSDIYPGADEVCDGKDNDCNEHVDGDDADNFIAESCALVEGICAGATRPCVDGRSQSCDDTTYGPLFERGTETLCDGRDNDCDGETDEALFSECYDGPNPNAEIQAGRPCSAGLVACADGRFPDPGDTDYACEGQTIPEAEDARDETRCDGVDNNCDGDLDEECRCLPGETRGCYTGADEATADNAPCRLGFQECGVDAHFGTTCVDERTPDPAGETCANPGVDNDCDGDNTALDIPGYGDTCDTGLAGRCSPGVRACVGDALVCVSQDDPIDEDCDNPGSDDDCNGIEDDVPGLGDDCTVTDFDGFPIAGACQSGTYQCDGSGGLVCTPGSTTGEVCNFVDDDCNSATDDGVDTTEDNAHCGACFNACGGADPSCCDSSCTSLLTDVAHCSACDNVCPTPTEHSQAACCAVAGEGTCVDLAFDDAHCGDCNDPCSGGTPDCCGAACTDLDTDENNCGACGATCASGTEQCCGGSCVPIDSNDFCASCDNDCDDISETCCDTGSGLACAHLDTSGSCGACGVTCGSGAQPACCDQGAGVGVCLDLDDGDVANCGGCGTTCTGSAPACCDEGGTGACRDTGGGDISNCGGCGTTCDGVTPGCCTEGDTGLCVDLDSDETHCGSCGEVCVGATDTCCGAGCVDILSDASHCGGCGITCSRGESCCDGFCVDLTQANETHCGVCSNRCDFSGGERCCDTGSGLDCTSAPEGSCP